jgi:hypothetical protein
MAITKIQAGALPADVITTAAIDDASITHAKLHTTMDLSSKTVTLPTLSTLNTTGSVGIGTSSIATGTKLIIKAATDQNFEVEYTSGGKLRLSALNDARSANVPLQFTSTSFEFLSGNVGIGTDSPKRHLHLNNPAALTTKIQITNLTTGASTDGDGFQLGISNDGTANIEQRENLDMAFATNNTERMRIDSSGNVGIGTNNPGAKLHVNGTFKLDGNYPVGTSNVIIGDGAGENIASGGSQHTAVGNLALYKVASTNRSTAVGDQAGRWSEGYYNTFIGAEAGKGANGTHTSNSNIAIGTQALQQITSGSNNVAIGAWTGGSPASMAINSSGAKNTAVGVGTLGNNTTASNSTAIGFNALLANNANDNTAVGFEAMLVSDSGGATENTAIGSRSMKSNRGGDGNTAAGRESLLNNISGGDNVAIGKLSMATNNSGSQNVAIGNEALRLNSSGSQNVAIGRESLYNNTVSQNVAVGHHASYNNVSGIQNVAVGEASAYQNQSGGNNTSIGRAAGYNNTASNNVFVGWYSGFSADTGSHNTFVGNNSGTSMGSSSKNTIVGRFDGNSNSVDIRADQIMQEGNIVLSDGDGVPKLFIGASQQGSYSFPLARFQGGIAVGQGGAGINQQGGVISTSSDNDTNSRLRINVTEGASANHWSPMYVKITFVGCATNGSNQICGQKLIEMRVYANSVGGINNVSSLGDAFTVNVTNDSGGESDWTQIGIQVSASGINHHRAFFEIGSYDGIRDSWRVSG